MSDRRDYFFRQKVSEAELDQGFTDLENADRNATLDAGTLGVLYALGVAQAGTPNLTVLVAGPGAAYDQTGERIFIASNQTVDVSKDSSNVSTTVSAPGKERKISVFIQFDRALSDPRVDGNSITVYFQRAESFKFIVMQGAEANTGTGVPPSLLSNGILLADITLSFGTTAVTNGLISVARRQDAIALSGSPQSIRRGRLVDAISDLLSIYNNHVSGTGNHIPATAVDYAGGAAWLGGATNPATTVEAQLDKIITDLSVTGATANIGGSTFLFPHIGNAQLSGMLFNVEINVPWKDTDNTWTGGEILGAASGVRGSIANMVAVASPANGRRFLVDDAAGLSKGWFTFRSGSARTTDGVFIVAPGAGGGRWEHELFSLLSSGDLNAVGIGLAVVGPASGAGAVGTGRISPNVVPWGIVMAPVVDPGSDTSTNSGSLTTLYSFATPANVSAGDIIDVQITALYTTANAGDVAAYYAENGGADVRASATNGLAAAGNYIPVPLSFTRVVGTGGPFAVRIKASTSGGGTMSVRVTQVFITVRRS